MTVSPDAHPPPMKKPDGGSLNLLRGLPACKPEFCAPGARPHLGRHALGASLTAVDYQKLLRGEALLMRESHS